jgi:hypothetical protein
VSATKPRTFEVDFNTEIEILTLKVNRLDSINSYRVFTITADFRSALRTPAMIERWPKSSPTRNGRFTASGQRVVLPHLLNALKKRATVLVPQCNNPLPYG